jgi:hypothetical protein
MRWTLPFVCLAAGCERDPSFFGIWDLDTITVDDASQTDAGVFEILDNSDLALLLRYEWAGGFVPDPNPSLIRGTTSATENEDVLDNYQQKGEVYSLVLEAFGAEFAVAEYTGSRALLEAPEARYPRPFGEAPDEQLHAITLEISR